MKPNLSNEHCQRILAEGGDPQRQLNMHEGQRDRFTDELIRLPWYRRQEKNNLLWHIEFHRKWIEKLTV